MMGLVSFLLQEERLQRQLSLQQNREKMRIKVQQHGSCHPMISPLSHPILDPYYTVCGVSGLPDMNLNNP